jgi:hypothetical protein
MSLSPGNADEVLKDLARGLKKLHDGLPEYEKRERYYQGRQREVIAHPKLRTLLDRYGDAFRLNYAAVPCDAIADRIDLTGLTTTDPALDRILHERLWEPNALQDDADDWHLHAYYLGDYYVIAEYIDSADADFDDEDDATDDESGTGIGTVELTPKDPFSTVVVYQRSNSRIPDFAVQLIEGLEQGDFDAFVYYDDETWAFTTQEGTGQDGQWTISNWILDLDDDDEGRPAAIPNTVVDDNGRPIFPVFHFRPDSKPYGTPVNAKMFGPQDAITKIQATQMASMDYYGFPQRYATLDPNAEDDDDIDDDFGDDGLAYHDREGFPGVRPEGRSKLSSDPGGVWMLRGVTKAGQFQPADPKGFLDPLTFQIRAGATLTRTPLYEFDLDGSQGEAPSGEARRRADAPITKHAEKIKGSFSTVWAAIGGYTLAALGVGAGRKVSAVWAPSETATDKEGMDLVALKVKNGLPPRQALLEAGYLQEQVDQWLPIDEVNGLAMPLTPDLLAQLAEAFMRLGQAKNLGAVTDDWIRRLARPVIGDIATLEPLPEHQLERVTDAVAGTPPAPGQQAAAQRPAPPRPFGGR